MFKLNKGPFREFEKNRAKAFKAFRQLGLKAFLLKLLDWAEIYRRVYLYVIDLEDSVTVESTIPLTFRVLEKSESDALYRFNPEIDAPTVQQRLKNGDFCFLTIHNGEIVAYSWAGGQKAYIEYLDCYMVLNRGEVYGYDVYVSPGYRGNRIASAQSSFKGKYLKAAGYAERIAAVLPENIASLKHFGRVGHKRFGMAGYIKIGPLRRYFSRLEPEYRGKREINLLNTP